MATKSFCDICGNETDQSSRRYEHLPLKQTESDIGLDTTILIDGNSDSRNKICDDCLGDVLLECVRIMPTTRGARFLKDAEIAADLRQELEAQTAKLARTQTELDRTLTIYEERVKKAEERAVTDAQEIAVLAGQVKTVQEAAERRIRQAAAQLNQEFQDRLNDPDYIESVERREQKRRGESNR